MFRLQPPKPRYRPAHKPRWNLDNSDFAYTAPVSNVHPEDLWLPPHETAPVDPYAYADAWPTQTLSAVPPEPAPEPVCAEGPDLLTGEPRLFGNPALAVLHGVALAVSWQLSTYFGPA
jgi:hypothetical protein